METHQLFLSTEEYSDTIVNLKLRSPAYFFSLVKKKKRIVRYIGNEWIQIINFFAAKLKLVFTNYYLENKMTPF